MGGLPVLGFAVFSHDAMPFTTLLSFRTTGENLLFHPH